MRHFMLLYLLTCSLRHITLLCLLTGGCVCPLPPPGLDCLMPRLLVSGCLSFSLCSGAGAGSHMFPSRGDILSSIENHLLYLKTKFIGKQDSKQPMAVKKTRYVNLSKPHISSKFIKIHNICLISATYFFSNFLIWYLKSKVAQLSTTKRASSYITWCWLLTSQFIIM